jgi:hypothetical protein
VALVIPFQRRRPKVESDPYSSEAFWRRSMVPASIGMSILIVGAVATLVIGLKTGWLRGDSSNWVLVAALVSVIGLTKIVIANMFFFLLMQDDSRLDPPPAPPPPDPGTRIERQRNRKHAPARLDPAQKRRVVPDRRKRAARMSAD